MHVQNLDPLASKTSSILGGSWLFLNYMLGYLFLQEASFIAITINDGIIFPAPIAKPGQVQE